MEYPSITLYALNTAVSHNHSRKDKVGLLFYVTSIPEFLQEKESGDIIAICPFFVGANPYLRTGHLLHLLQACYSLSSKYSGHYVGKRNLIMSQEKQMA